MTQTWEEKLEGKAVIRGTLAGWRDRPTGNLGKLSKRPLQTPCPWAGIISATALSWCWLTRKWFFERQSEDPCKQWEGQLHARLQQQECSQQVKESVYSTVFGTCKTESGVLGLPVKRRTRVHHWSKSRRGSLQWLGSWSRLLRKGWENCEPEKDKSKEGRCIFSFLIEKCAKKVSPSWRYTAVWRKVKGRSWNMEIVVRY